jgi:hypothetical protein
MRVWDSRFSQDEKTAQKFLAPRGLEDAQPLLGASTPGRDGSGMHFAFHLCESIREWMYSAIVVHAFARRIYVCITAHIPYPPWEDP